MAITKCALSDLPHIIAPPDVLLCSASYESRCRTIPDTIDPVTLNHVLIVENMNLRHYVDENAQQLRNRFGTRNVSVEANTADPLLTADNLKQALLDTHADTPQRYLVDITTFTHESLLIAVKLLRMMLTPADAVQFCYCSAADYASSLPTEEKWLSKGVAEVRSVLGYPGEVLPSRKTHLIVLVGYEQERASKLIEVFEPTQITLGYGQPASSVSEEHHKANCHFHKLVAESVSKYARVSDFAFSCLNPWETRDAILAEADRTPDHNIVVAPLNTKISTIGCALAALERETIQLCYAPALIYNYDDYSRPGDTCHLFDLPELLQFTAQ